MPAFDKKLDKQVNLDEDYLIHLAHLIAQGKLTLGMVLNRFGPDIASRVNDETSLYKWRGNRPMWTRRVR